MKKKVRTFCVKLYQLVFLSPYKSAAMVMFVANGKKKHRMAKAIIRKHLDRRYHIHVGNGAIIGKGLYFPHPQNIVIGGG